MRFPIDANLLRAAMSLCQEFGHQVTMLPTLFDPVTLKITGLFKAT